MIENSMENTGNEKTTTEPGWEREVIEKLAFAAINEQRKTRLWGIFFKILLFLYLLVILFMSVYPNFKAEMESSGEGHTAVIDVKGEIGEDMDTSAETIIEGLHNAIKDEGTKGVILHMNSPGGTPVQAEYVYQEIRAIKKENPDKPVYAVISDICASGCYYIASATDKIFVSPASIVGSIGVIMNGFGFVGTLEKFGVERRLLTAGSHKAMLDPFSPVNEAENEHMQVMLDQVHQQFIKAIKNGRGDRLKETPDMFSGLVWTGEESIKLGLADDIGSDDYVAETVIGEKKIRNYTPQERLIDQLAGKLGASFGHSLGAMVKNWSIQ